MIYSCRWLLSIVGPPVEHAWFEVADGRIRPVVHATFPLADATQAHRTMEQSAHIGKILLLP